MMGEVTIPSRQKLESARVVCADCGAKYGQGRPKHILSSTYHIGICNICGIKKNVTEFRDFGYLHYKFGRSLESTLFPKDL